MIKRFYPEQWSLFKDGIMYVENRCFPSELAMTEEEVFRDCCSKDSVVFLALDDDKVIGAIYVNSLNDKDSDWLDGCWNPQEYAHIDKKVAYISSVGVLPEYQNKGIGKLLRYEVSNALKELGYEYIVSHSNSGAMTHIDESLGAVILEENKNWGGANETHYLTEMKL